MGDPPADGRLGKGGEEGKEQIEQRVGIHSLCQGQGAGNT